MEQLLKGRSWVLGLLTSVSPARLQESQTLCLYGCGARLFWLPFTASIPCSIPWRGSEEECLPTHRQGNGRHRDRTLLTQGVTAGGNF